MLKLSENLATAIAAEVKSGLDGGFLFIFSGPVPANADEALDSNPGPGQHVTLVMVSVDDDGVTGLTFDAPATGDLYKAAAEVWEGTILQSGAASFYRFVEPGDDPYAAGSGKSRIQGLCGTSPFSSDLVLPTVNLTAGGGSTVPISIFVYSVPQG